MSQFLFKPVSEGHDGKGRVVFVCTDANGFFVYKPQTGFRSKHYATANGPAILKCFTRQEGCNHANAFYEKHEMPAVGETYPDTAEKKSA